MLKRIVFIFAVSLLIIAGLLKYQRSEGASTSQFLTLNVSPITYIAEPSTILLLHPQGTRTQILNKNIFSISPIQWSPDGTWLYFIVIKPDDYSYYRIQRFNVQTEEIETLVEATDMQFTQNGQHWAYLDMEGRLANNTGERLVNNQIIHYLPATGDNQWVYYVTGDYIYRVHRNGKFRERLTYSRHSIGNLIIAPDGKWLAFFGQDASVPSYTITWQTIGEKRVDIIYQSNTVPTLAWSADSQFLAFVEPSFDHASSKIFIVNRNNQEIIEIATLPHFINRILWSADGQWIYYTTSSTLEFQVYRVNIVTGTQELIYYDEGLYRLYPTMSWSPIIDKAWHPKRLIISGALLLLGILMIIWGRKIFMTHALILGGHE